MINLEHKLTVDDLIVEYMAYKVKNGYEPSFLTSEFMTFLECFERKIKVEDSLYENDKLFERFFERKTKQDWSIIKNWDPMEKIAEPHMNMEISDKYNDYIIKANYKLGDYDIGVINTYFMDNGMGRYENFKGQVFKIRSLIAEFLSDQPKRKIDDQIEINSNDLIAGQYVAAEIIVNIWESYINDLIKNHRWPIQCKDINKYLFETDLAQIIGIESIKNKLIELYNEFSKRIAILYHQDKNLQISTHSNFYLARANYDLLIQGYEKIMKTTFGEFRKSLDIDLSTLTFKESHEIDGVYNLDEDPDVKTTTNKLRNENTKKLILSLNKTNL